ncbi:MAG: nitrous oxide-stimulated promoter family protein [Verrucomicrobia bacterium]|nr:nitrous oxide-stimulated promoter family protein [Verrucomicrobiota bacterium]
MTSHRITSHESRITSHASSDSRRFARERRTVLAMIRLYCSHQHGRSGHLCAECVELWDYVQLRLERCPFQDNKPTCAKCPVHCYQPARRAQIQTVMRYAGPRMLWRHPVLAIRHLLDGTKKAPAKK